MSKISIGIVGFGKIAQDQHVRAIRASDDFLLHSVADPGPVTDSVQQFDSVEDMLNCADGPDAIAVCTPPQVRFDIARTALNRPVHLLLEKPPCATSDDVRALHALARESGVTLFCAWHSRFAPAVEPARQWLSQRQILRVRIIWKEDVQIWHPGQTWIWNEGGFGVYDPGMNALSIVTRILPGPIRLREALLQIPADCETPVASELTLGAEGFDISASFDFLQKGPQTWDIEIETDAGLLVLADGGSRFLLNGSERELSGGSEYASLYAHFARLISAGESDADPTPLELVNDALRQGRRETVAPLHPG